MAATSGLCRIASTASLSPFTTLNTPSGRPACFKRSARMSEQEGSRSEGFSTKVLPQASATGNIHMGTMAGKLNGVIPAHTPSGCRTAQESTFVPTFSVNSPFSRWGMPQANSTTSSPRTQDPLASLNTLPCSDVSVAASLSMLASTRPLKRKMIRARWSGGVCDQAGKAAAAAATAASTSAVLASDTRACTSPVAGLKTSPKRLLRLSTILPLT